MVSENEFEFFFAEYGGHDTCASWVIFCILGVLIWHECIKAKDDWFMKTISVSVTC